MDLFKAQIALAIFYFLSSAVTFFSYARSSNMLWILCQNMQRATTEHQNQSNHGEIEWVSGCSRSIQREEAPQNRVKPSEKPPYLTQESRIGPFMKALQRISAGAAAVRYSQPTPVPEGGQEGGEAREDHQEEPQASAVRSFFEERAAEGTTRRIPSADTIMEVRLYLQEAPFEGSADLVRCWETKASILHILHKQWHGDCGNMSPLTGNLLRNRADHHREKKGAFTFCC